MARKSANASKSSVQSPQRLPRAADLGIPAVSLPSRSWWQMAIELIFLYCWLSRATCPHSVHRAWLCHCRTPATCTCRINTADSPSSCVKSLQPVWVGAAKRKHLRGEGELENLESLLQWLCPGLGPSSVGLRLFCSLLPVLLPPLQGPEPSYPHPPSGESPVIDKGSSQGLPTPILLYPRLPWGTWKQDLALRQRVPCVPAQRACAHPAVARERADCSAAEPWVHWEARGRSAPTALSARPCCVGTHQCWETVNEDPVCINTQRHWWSHSREEKEAVSEQSGFSTVIRDSDSCFIKPLVW